MLIETAADVPARLAREIDRALGALPAGQEWAVRLAGDAPHWTVSLRGPGFRGLFFESPEGIGPAIEQALARAQR
jgi:hypothetical protein